LEGKFQYVSPSTFKMFGYKPQDVKDLSANDLTHPEDLPLVLELLGDLIQNPNNVPHIQYRFKHKDGSYRWIESTFSNLLAEPSVEAIVINFRDITENKLADDVANKLSQDLLISYDATLEGWSNTLKLREHETAEHSQRVVQITVEMAKILNFSEEEILNAQRGALLHDIGKMGVPDNILLKPGPLSDDEWVIMKMHPIFAFELLSEIPYLQPALDIPYAHHERWDGSGYPLGLKGKAIPLAARIFAIVDVWDALLSDRPYRPAWKKPAVYKYMQEQAGKQFDPEIVEVFLKMVMQQDAESGQDEPG
jgi:PAS domain S-box-containing protein